MITETIYAGRDNSFSLQMIRGGEVISLLAITSYALHLSDDTEIVDQLRFTEKSDGVVEISIGDLFASPGNYRAHLVTFDPVNVNGVRWPEFRLKVK